MQRCFNEIVDICVSAKNKADDYDKDIPHKFRSAVRHINSIIYDIHKILNSNISDCSAQNVMRIAELQYNDTNIVNSLKSQSHILENIGEESKIILRAARNFVKSDDEKTNQYILDTDICPKIDVDKLRLKKSYGPIYNYLQSIMRNNDSAYRVDNFYILIDFTKDFRKAFSPNKDFLSFVQSMEEYADKYGAEKFYSSLEKIFCDTNVLRPCGLVELVENMTVVDWPVEPNELC